MKNSLQKIIRNFWEGKSNSEELSSLLLSLEEESEKSGVLESKEGTEDELSERRLKTLKIIRAKARKERRSFFLRRVAASTAALLVLGSFAVIYQFKRTDQTTVSNKTTIENNTSHTAKKVDLEDGSTVLLQPGAKLTYNLSFNKTDRDVEIEGEARFLVTKSAIGEFNVRTKEFTVTVLGTDFTVSTINKAKQTINLHHGKIEVKPSVEGKINFANDYLHSGENLEINLDDNILAKSYSPEDLPKSPDHTFSEKDPRTYNLTYYKTPLSRVFLDLSIRYNTTIDINSADVSKLYLIGDFEKNESLEAILPLICNMNNLKYEIKNNTVKIKNL